MIGDMYEGLTRDLLSRSLFADLDLRVVTGKVRIDANTYSSQIDAMVVIGDGEQMPFSQHYLYPPEQVVAAIEVKKTLYGLEVPVRVHESRGARIWSAGGSLGARETERSRSSPGLIPMREARD